MYGNFYGVIVLLWEGFWIGFDKVIQSYWNIGWGDRIDDLSQTVKEKKMRNGKIRTCNQIIWIYLLSQLSYALQLKTKQIIRFSNNLPLKLLINPMPQPQQSPHHHYEDYLQSTQLLNEALTNQLQSQREEIETLKRQLKNKNSAHKDLQNKIQQQQHKITELTNLLQNKRTECQQLKQVLKQVHKEYSQAVNYCKAFEVELEKRGQEREEKEREVEELKCMLEEQFAKGDRVRSEKERVQQEVGRLREHVCGQKQNNCEPFSLTPQPDPTNPSLESHLLSIVSQSSSLSSLNQNSNQNYNSELHRLRIQLELQKSSKYRAQIAKEKLKEEVEELITGIKGEWKKEVNELRVENVGLRGEMKGLGEEVRRLQVVVRNVMKENQGLREYIGKLQMQNQGTESDHQNLQTKITELLQQNQTLQNEKKQLTEKLNSFEKYQAGLEQQLESAYSELDTLREALEQRENVEVAKRMRSKYCEGRVVGNRVVVAEGNSDRGWVLEKKIRELREENQQILKGRMKHY